MRGLTAAVVVLLVAAVAAGLAWAHWAEPGRWEVTEAGVVLTQQASRGQFRVELLFIAIGSGLCLAWGVAMALLTRPRGWWLAPVAAVAAALAALVAWQVGLAAGPPDPSTVRDLALGDTFSDQLAVGAVPSFLTWPAAALGGVLLVLLFTVDRSARAQLAGDDGEER